MWNNAAGGVRLNGHGALALEVQNPRVQCNQNVEWYPLGLPSQISWNCKKFVVLFVPLDGPSIPLVGGLAKKVQLPCPKQKCRCEGPRVAREDGKPHHRVADTTGAELGGVYLTGSGSLNPTFATVKQLIVVEVVSKYCRSRHGW